MILGHFTDQRRIGKFPEGGWPREGVHGSEWPESGVANDIIMVI